jgi:hypothetical protein
VDQKHISTHAIRRAAYSAIGWEYLHLPLHASIIVVGGSMADIIKEFVKDSSKLVDVGNRYSFVLG